jgi:hypothetical protein
VYNLPVCIVKSQARDAELLYIRQTNEIIIKEERERSELEVSSGR